MCSVDLLYYDWLISSQSQKIEVDSIPCDYDKALRLEIAYLRHSFMTYDTVFVTIVDEALIENYLLSVQSWPVTMK